MYGSDIDEAVVDMLFTFTNYSVAGERLSTPEIVNKLMKGTARHGLAKK